MNEETQSQIHGNELKKLNKWLGILVIFIIVWTGGTIFYIDKKTPTVVSQPIPIIMVDPLSGRITNISYTNIFPPAFSSNINNNVTNSSSTMTNDLSHPLFRQKDSYEIKDFVIINYFFIKGMVVEKHGDSYTILYKDHNHILQKVMVQKDFLLVPTSYYSVNPASLLID